MGVRHASGGGGGGTDTQDAEDRVEEDWACPQRPCPATQTPRCPMAHLGPPKLLQTNLVQSPQGGKTSKRHQSLPWRDLVGGAGFRGHGRAPAQKKFHTNA